VSGLMLVWLVVVARPFITEYLPKVLADLGDLGSRVESGLIDYGQVDASQRIVSLAARGLTVGVVGLAILGLLRGIRTGIQWRSTAVLSFAPLTLMLASSYGDEILFRVFLFILPVAAVLCGALWFSREPSGTRMGTIVSLSAVLIVMAFASLVARHGNDVKTAFTDDEVAAATTMYEAAPPGSAVIQLSVSYATKFENYENLTELSVASFSNEAKQRFLADPDVVFDEWLTEGDFTEGYVLFTRSQVAETERGGFLPLGSPEEIVTDLRSSEHFSILYDSDDGVLFRHEEGR
jgi:lysylphosphatidylglycerol synthetase-like protein (DUF2156 family)